jgi:hypothetical protein
MNNYDKEVVDAHKMQIIYSLLHLFYVIEKRNICKIHKFTSIDINNSRNTVQKIKRRLSNQLLAIHIYDK